jgi:uncharacterized membrane protein YbhN (UPF0104 family)
LFLAFGGALSVGQLHSQGGRLIGLLAAAGAMAAIGGVALYVVIRRRGGTGPLAKIAASVTLLLARPSRLVACLVIGMGVQALFLVLNSQLGLATGVQVGFGAWFFAWPLSKLVATLPISLAGLGVREAALVAFLRPFGAAPADVMAAGLLWQGALFTGGALGWLMTQGLQSTGHRTQNLEPRT